jgi:hypothetical protein
LEHILLALEAQVVLALRVLRVLEAQVEALQAEERWFLLLRQGKVGPMMKVAWEEFRFFLALGVFQIGKLLVELVG